MVTKNAGLIGSLFRKVEPGLIEWKAPSIWERRECSADPRPGREMERRDSRRENLGDGYPRTAK